MANTARIIVPLPTPRGGGMVADGLADGRGCVRLKDNERA